MKVNILKNSIVCAVVMMLCVGTASAHSGRLFKVSKINISRGEGQLLIHFDVDARHIKPGLDREVVFTPVIRAIGSADSLRLPAITVAGKNSYYAHLRNKDIMPGEKLVRAGSDELVAFRETVRFQPWMQRCLVVMREETQTCCDPIEDAGDTPVAELNYVIEPFHPDFRYVNIVGDSLVVMSAEGRAFVTFVVDRTELKPDYMNNPKEIGKIIASIDKVKNDPDATITSVSIKGFASPEGTYKHNIELAMGRTATLKEYVRSHYNFDQSIMHTDFEPEDWQGLIEWLDTCRLEHRTEILDIARSDMAPDAKDLTIKRRFPEEYSVILKTVYPWLRHSDYKVTYSIRTFADIDELKRVFRTTPERLRPVDFSRIAATYSPDSPEYEATYMKAVEIYPYNNEANLNAANILMKRGDLAEAARYVARSGDSVEAIYTRGVLAARNGDFERAQMYMTTAAEQGLDVAISQLELLKKHRAKPTVKYLIQPTEK